MIHESEDVVDYNTSWIKMQGKPLFRYQVLSLGCVIKSMDKTCSTYQLVDRH